MAPLLALLLVLTGCDSTGAGSDDGATSPVALAFQIGSGAASTSTLAKSTELTDGDGTTLTLDRIEIILSEIEFERDDDSDCPRGDDGRDDDDDDCEEVEAGPVLVDLPLDAGQPVVQIETDLTEGRWEEVEFEIDPLDRDDDDERAFLDDTGFPEDVSIRVTGTFARDGESPRAFTYLSDLDAEKEIEFEPPLVVNLGESKSVTFSVDVDRWFRTESGRLIDPDEANDDGRYEDLVEDNIEDSFDGFEDDDRDGERDDDDDDDDGDDDDDD